LSSEPFHIGKKRLPGAAALRKPGNFSGSESSLVTVIPAQDFDLNLTFRSGQTFRWSSEAGAWDGVILGRWVRLSVRETAIAAEVAEPVGDWGWLARYLQTEVCLPAVLATFPEDEPMRLAVTACRGLRLLRQEPWECLASFILSSNKQIVQIQEIIGALCRRFGDRIPVASGCAPAFSFPTADRLAGQSESELRACRMGFRAPYLLESARMVAGGQVALAGLEELGLSEARNRLLTLPGVGPKIADCVLLFAYGFPTAFPIDVWIRRGLQQLYFSRQQVSAKAVRAFAEAYFGPFAGYAQQYLFHYLRTREKPPAA
jgi:N-glycosylase/DNA lyase